jgi:hypothetical protein
MTAQGPHPKLVTLFDEAIASDVFPSHSERVAAFEQIFFSKLRAWVYIRQQQAPDKARLLDSIHSCAERHSLDTRGFSCDIGRSGRSLLGLPSLLRLLQLCLAREVDVILVQDMDRLTRAEGAPLVLEVLRKHQVQMIDLAAGGPVDLRRLMLALPTKIDRCTSRRKALRP